MAENTYNHDCNCGTTYPLRAHDDLCYSGQCACGEGVYYVPNEGVTVTFAEAKKCHGIDVRTLLLQKIAGARLSRVPPEVQDAMQRRLWERTVRQKIFQFTG